MHSLQARPQFPGYGKIIFEETWNKVVIFVFWLTLVFSMYFLVAVLLYAYL